MLTVTGRENMAGYHAWKPHTFSAILDIKTVLSKLNGSRKASKQASDWRFLTPLAARNIEADITILTLLH
jgi:hypothetical protein